VFFRTALTVRELLKINCSKYFEETFIVGKSFMENPNFRSHYGHLLFSFWLFSAIFCDFHNFQLHVSEQCFTGQI
jgi:hypothetical protein